MREKRQKFGMGEGKEREGRENYDKETMQIQEGVKGEGER